MKAVLFFCCYLLIIVIDAGTIDPTYEWKYVDFVWDSEEQKTETINSGKYDISASVLLDVDVSKDSRIFVTIERKEGVPVTLGIVDQNASGDGGPLIQPYPDWNTNLNDSCDGFTNVYRIAIDECNQLWVLDSGMINHEYKCPAKLMVYNLESNIMVREIPIPRELYENVLVTLIVDHVDKLCAHPTVYMADIYGGALLIYDSNGELCRLKADEFKPDIYAEKFKVAGEDLTLSIGLVGMALTPRDDDDPEDEQKLYFRPLSSYNMYHVMASELRDYCSTKKEPKIITEGYSTPSQSVSQTVASDVLFFGYTSETSLNCWNTYTDFSEENIGTLAKNEEELQWINGIKSYPKNSTGIPNVIFLTDKYQRVYNNTMDINEVNYRIFTFNSYIRTYGTVCY